MLTMAFSATVAHINECALPTWYSTFRRHTIKTVLIPLPDTFIAYLNEDSVILPPVGENFSAASESDEEPWSSDSEHSFSEEEFQTSAHVRSYSGC